MFSQLTFDAISADITSNCNLRCPFCVNDWRSIRGNTNISEETFSKIIELIPLAMTGTFLLSCLFEPTIHPDFVRLIQRIPSSGRSKVFFTTNLARRLPKETFQALSESNIRHICISVESLRPTVYEEMRRGARFSTFMDNLEDLVSVFRNNPSAPRLRYISMVFRQNLSELEDLASACHENYLAEVHEFRTPFRHSFPCMDQEWFRQSAISEKEWGQLVKTFSELPYTVTFSDVSLERGRLSRLLDPSEVPQIPGMFTNFPKRWIRVNSDGTIFLPWTKKRYEIHNINEIQNPQTFFKRKLYRVYDVATWPRWRTALRCYLRATAGLLSSDGRLR
jgi:MoaA/NifB/PqqE/SkfB family radical SAM enzyme